MYTYRKKYSGEAPGRTPDAATRTRRAAAPQARSSAELYTRAILLLRYIFDTMYLHALYIISTAGAPTVQLARVATLRSRQLRSIQRASD